MENLIQICAHFDDNLLSFVSKELSFKGDVHVIYTSEGDYLTKEAYQRGKAEFEAYTQKITAIREAKQLGRYFVDYYPDYGDVVGRHGPTKEAEREIFRLLETLLKSGKWIYCYTNDSLNPSHCNNRRIAEGLLRAPYVFIWNKFLLAFHNRSNYLVFRKIRTEIVCIK